MLFNRPQRRTLIKVAAGFQEVSSVDARHRDFTINQTLIFKFDEYGNPHTNQLPSSPWDYDDHDTLVKVIAQSGEIIGEKNVPFEVKDFALQRVGYPT